MQQDGEVWGTSTQTLDVLVEVWYTLESLSQFQKNNCERYTTL